MRCPKCSHEQRDTNECEACGLIFSRYRVVQERKKDVAEKKALAVERKSGVGMKFFQIILLAAVVASATYYFTSDKKVDLQKPAAESVAIKQNTPAPQRVRAVKSPQQTTVASSKAAPRRNGIELARKATVSIETPWGTGSGFFVNEYYIVTNRHVIELDQDKVAEFRQKIETARSLIDLEKQKLRDMRVELKKLARGPSRQRPH